MEENRQKGDLELKFRGYLEVRVGEMNHQTYLDFT